MKLNKILLSAALVASAFTASAQEEVTEYVFNPNWYVQGQFGLQETLGETSFGNLLSPNAQITVGYNFNPYIGARLAVNAWRSKGAEKVDGVKYSCDDHWRWYYVAPTVDAVVNLTNVFGGYNPTRLVDVDLIAGIGVNVGFDNHEAKACNAAYVNGTGGNTMLGNLWDGTKARFVGQFGADVNFNINKNWAVGLEVMANVLPDGYNSKIGENADWYFNALVGVKYTFGDKFTKRTRTVEPAVPCEPTVIERIIVQEPAPVQAPVVEQKETAVKKQDEMRREVYFKINTSTILKAEMNKVAEIAEFMKAHPSTKVVVTGYADKGTGTLAINLRLSKQRAQAVANALINKYGISSNRITVKSMGEEEYQPYHDPMDNRVAICIVE